MSTTENAHNPEKGTVQTRRLGDVIPAFDDGSPEMDEQIVICGAVDSRGHVCDEPEWMGPHTWHYANGGWDQWCSCGEDHAWDFKCEASATSISSSPTPTGNTK